MWKRFCSDRPYDKKWEQSGLALFSVSDESNVTATELLKDVTELQILGEIAFNKSLYEGLNAENHRTKHVLATTQKGQAPVRKWIRRAFQLVRITVIFLKDEVLYSLPVIIGSSVGGLLLLVAIIALLVKCGFFKRKYQQLNLESIRRAQLKADSLLEED
ncbi:hypothetical protein U0070_022488 [Myodes glareolus]|uniref:Uncharacterized protein n=1 Tax=Myodes glareolus TaxID=447135 RepID=A0AAW0HQ11_MYOGA